MLPDFETLKKETFVTDEQIEFLKNYEFGYELLLLNGILTFILLCICSKPKSYEL